MLLSLALMAAFSAGQAGAGNSPAKPAPIILDTDIGTDIDDAFALALALASPELDLRGVTTVGGDTQARAKIACKLLGAVGRGDVPVAWGREPQPAEAIEGQLNYLKLKEPDGAARPAAVPLAEPAVEFLYARLKAEPGKLSLVAIGPLTNLARLLREHPDCKPWIARIVLMGGSVRVGYGPDRPPDAEWNIKLDASAARTVFTSGVPLLVAPLDATATVKLEAPLRRRLFESRTPLAREVESLYRLWGQPTPTLFDPVAVALAISEEFCTLEELALDVDDQGFTRLGKGRLNARVATAVKAAEFLDWYVDRVAKGRAAEP